MAEQNVSLSKTAAALAAAAVLTMVILSAADHDGPVWILQGLLGAAAAITGYRAGGTNPRNRLAFAALAIGTVLFLVFFGYLIAEVV